MMANRLMAMLWEFLDRLLHWIRGLLLLYPNIRFVRTAEGKRRDHLLPESAAEAKAAAAKVVLPPGFKFGAATAAYQIEGGIKDTNWNRWEARKTRPHDGGVTIERGETGDTACDSWNRFEEDLQVVCDLGLNVYRFSVEWSRVEPSEGSFDERAVDKYADWCKKLRAKGVEPLITLHHFTEPGWCAPCQ